jgi:hypothetical protein
LQNKTNHCRKGNRKSTHLHTPSSPHVVVATNRLAITHEAKVHSRADELPVEGKVHATHGEQGPLGDGHDSINIPEQRKGVSPRSMNNAENSFFTPMTMRPNTVPAVPLTRLDHLGGSIIVRDVEPQAVGNSGVSTLPEAEGIPTHKVSTLTVGVVQGVEEEWSGRAQEVLNVLLKCIDVLASWVLGNLWDKQRDSASVTRLNRKRLSKFTI